MPTASLFDVMARDAAVRALTNDLLNTVHLLGSQPLAHGTGGGLPAPTPHGISLYVWRADARQSALGAASVAVYASLKKEFPDGGPVRVCTQLDNVTLNHAILRNAILKNGVLCSVLVRNPVLRNPVLGKPVLGCECISAIGVAYDGGIESIVCSRSDVLVRLTGFGHLGKRFGRLGNKP